MAAPMIMSPRHDSLEHFLPVLAGMSVFLVPQFVQFDFRAEVDRMSVLKSLPLKPVAVVIGELLAPVTVIVSVQMIFLIGAGISGSVSREMLFWFAAFLVPVDVLIYESENLVFLMFPYRQPSGNSGQSLPAMTRAIMTMLLKMLMFAAIAAVAAGLGGLVYWLTSDRTMGLSVAWIATMVGCLALLPALAWAFKRFDPAMDTPG